MRPGGKISLFPISGVSQDSVPRTTSGKVTYVCMYVLPYTTILRCGEGEEVVTSIGRCRQLSIRIEIDRVISNI